MGLCGGDRLSAPAGDGRHLHGHSAGGVKGNVSAFTSDVGRPRQGQHVRLVKAGQVRQPPGGQIEPLFGRPVQANLHDAVLPPVEGLLADEAIVAQVRGAQARQPRARGQQQTELVAIRRGERVGQAADPYDRPVIEVHVVVGRRRQGAVGLAAAGLGRPAKRQLAGVSQRNGPLDAAANLAVVRSGRDARRFEQKVLVAQHHRPYGGRQRRQHQVHAGAPRGALGRGDGTDLQDAVGLGRQREHHALGADAERRGLSVERRFHDRQARDRHRQRHRALAQRLDANAQLDVQLLAFDDGLVARARQRKTARRSGQLDRGVRVRLVPQLHVAAVRHQNLRGLQCFGGVAVVGYDQTARGRQRLRGRLGHRSFTRRGLARCGCVSADGQRDQHRRCYCGGRPQRELRAELSGDEHDERGRQVEDNQGQGGVERAVDEGCQVLGPQRQQDRSGQHREDEDRLFPEGAPHPQDARQGSQREAQQGPAACKRIIGKLHDQVALADAGEGGDAGAGRRFGELDGQRVAPAGAERSRPVADPHPGLGPLRALGRRFLLCGQLPRGSGLCLGLAQFLTGRGLLGGFRFTRGWPSRAGAFPRAAIRQIVTVHNPAGHRHRCEHPKGGCKHIARHPKERLAGRRRTSDVVGLHLRFLPGDAVPGRADHPPRHFVDLHRLQGGPRQSQILQVAAVAVGVHHADRHRRRRPRHGHQVVAVAVAFGLGLPARDADRPQLGALRQRDGQELQARVDQVERRGGAL